MHSIQKKILELAKHENVGSYGYRKLAEKVGISHPQTAKYHLQKLVKDGLLHFDHEAGYVVQERSQNNQLIKLPLLGYANCGQPMMYTEISRADEHLTVSPAMLKKQAKDCFAVQARGDSMNRANTGDGAIQDNDYVIIDGSNKALEQGAYVLASVDGLATIKKVAIDQERQLVALTPESTSKHMPIYVHGEDESNLICHGRVVGVVPNLG